MIERCRFCEIINGSQNNEEVIFENESYIVITDRFRMTSIGPICLIITKKHKQNILKLDEIEGKGLIFILHIVLKAMQNALNNKGFRIWTAINKEAGQSILHFHMHIVPCNSIKDRMIANFPGIYDLFIKISKRKEQLESQNFMLAEKIRKEIQTGIANNTNDNIT